MIVHHVEQGSPEWQRLRAGVVTASQVHRILTPSGGLSKQAVGYRNTLLGEWLTGQPLDDDYVSGFMARGRQLEGEALAWYSFRYDLDVERVGFVQRDDGYVGCSPDCFIPPNKGGEVKCLSLTNHIGGLLDSDRDHYVQVQACLWLTEREAWERIYFHPTLPPVVVPFVRDDDFISKMSAAVDAFVSDMLLPARNKLLSLGCTPYVPPKSRGTLITEVPGGYEPTPEEEAELIARGLEAVREASA